MHFSGFWLVLRVLCLSDLLCFRRCWIRGEAVRGAMERLCWSFGGCSKEGREGLLLPSRSYGTGKDQEFSDRALVRNFLMELDFYDFFSVSFFFFFS